MARPAFTDPLQTTNFYLFDIGPIDALSIPIFIPLFGFSSITSPELTLTTQQITQGNALYPHTVITGANVGPITLSRGISAVDSDFWRWINVSLRGNTGGFTSDKLNVGEIGGVTYRRNLLLVHFFRNFPNGLLGAGAALTTGGGIAAATAFETGSLSSSGDALDPNLVSGGVTLAQLGLVEAIGVAGPLADVPWSQQSRGFFKVPARAFLLRNCIPTRYKAGTDFDASTAAVSIAELEVDVESFEEIALAAN